MSERGYEISSNDGDGFFLTHEGTKLRTPAGHDYCLPTRALAQAIQDSIILYEEEKERILKKKEGLKKPLPFPTLLQCAATLLDKTQPDPDKLRQSLLGHVKTELLCHRAEKPESLVQKQNEVWQPVLDWLDEKMGIKLEAKKSILPQPIAKETMDKLAALLDHYDAPHLVALNLASEAATSLVLGIALIEQHLTSEEVFLAAELEMMFQMTNWGTDPLLSEKLNAVRSDLETAAKWMKLLKEEA